ncbi:hypothetical protein AB0D04_10790 [Streptomyces sp. NPDC048483]|uniref:hypothetical protein n=1 Tax=Streptomyces sp. NPDC048483 TaxID=3154927 RepID=UPI00344187E5
MSAGGGMARGEHVSYQDPLAVPRSGLSDPHDCPGCALLKEQLSEILQEQNNLALWEVLDNVKKHKKYGHPEHARPSQ